MDCKIFLESILYHTPHTLETISEILDVNVKELYFIEDIDDRTQKKILELYDFLDTYGLVAGNKMKFNQ